MTGAMHTCGIGGCRAQIATSAPICNRHREQLQDSKRGRTLVESIDQQFVRKQQGIRGAALKYQEAISEATRTLHEGQPQPKAR